MGDGMRRWRRLVGLLRRRRASALAWGSVVALALPACTLRRSDGESLVDGSLGADGATPTGNGSAFDGALDGSNEAASDAGTAKAAPEGMGNENDDRGPSADAGAPDVDENGFCPPEAGPSAATPLPVLSFDHWPDGGTVPAEVAISSQFPGVVFSSFDCGGPITYSDGEESSPPNFLVGYPLRNNVGVSPIAMDLANPVSNVGVTLISVGESTVTVTAYDSSLSVVSTISVTHPGTGNGTGAHDPVTVA